MLSWLIHLLALRIFPLVSSKCTLSCPAFRNYVISEWKRPISNIPVKIEVSSQLIQIDLSEIRWHFTEVNLDLLQETYINGQGVETSAPFNTDN